MNDNGDVERIVIDPFSPTDLDAIMEMEVASFPVPWTRRSYEDVISLDNVSTWVARIGDEIVGYMLTQYVADEMELHTFAVKSSMRRRGVGARLIQNMISDAGHLGLRNIYLLVRPNNIAARTLYEKTGFQLVGIRKHYYQDNGEDALVMRLELDG
ncbi:MAG: ribosomal protein S18-alanine N-acetyltransferase [Deltaproteobacteria bacterium]|jgi:[ribosomal protein S18]-alanine N-acetyltransferase|nr:ribosomal protein S18-alanine N-acetyltransferase [Deltaproteobacteria bacterium]